MFGSQSPAFGQILKSIFILRYLDDGNLRQAIACSSVVAWQYSNLLGEYDFSEERLQDSVGINLPHLFAGPAS